MATFGTTIGSGGFRFYDRDHEVSYNYVAGIYGGNFQGPMLLDSGDAEGSSTNLSGHWRVINAQVRNNVIVDCPEGVRIGHNYSLAPSGCTIDGNAVIRAGTGQAVTQKIAPVSTTITNNTYFATPAAGAFTQDSAGIWRKTGLGPRLTFLQAGDVGINGDLNDSDGTGALVGGGGTGPGDPDPPPPTDTTTAAGKFGWGQPLPISDEFDYTGPPDPNKWKLPGTDWAGHAGNGRRRPERQTVQDGRLVMTGLANGDSGWMQHKLDQEYGRYEVRVRAYNTGTSNGNEYSPVLLIWPASNSRKADGEYDFYEPGEPGSTELTAFMHFPGDGDQQRRFDKTGVDLSQWHNIAFEWTPDHLKGFIDGQEWFSTSGGAGSGRRDIQDMGPGHGTIQLDNFDGTNQTPATMEVEWYRVYTLTPVTPPPGALTVSASGIASGQQFGVPSVSGAESPPPSGSHATLLGSGDTVLPFTLGYTLGDGTGPPPAGSQTVSLAGKIPSKQAFGLPLFSVADGPQDVRAVGIGSATGFGSPSVVPAPPPPTAPGGVLVPSVYAVDRAGRLTPLPAWTKLNVSPVRNSMGSISIEYPSGAPGFSTLFDGVSAHPLRALEVRIWLGGSQEGALGGWLTQKAGDDLVPGGSWSFTGHFHEWLLGKALVAPQERTEENEKGELRFAGVTPGVILATIMDQAQARGALPLVTRDFSATHDSNGKPWPKTISSFNISPKTTIRQVVDKLVELDAVEYEVTAARVWRAYAADTMGVDRTTGQVPLTFAHAVNLSQYSRRESAEDAGTAVLAAGSEGFYAWAESATAQAELGWRAEVAGDAGQLSTADAVQAYAATFLEAIRNGVAEFVGDVEFATGVPLPIVGWGIGDWAYTWVNNKRRRLRIAQIDLTFTRGEPPRGTVALNDLFANKVAQLYRRLNAISVGDAVVGTSTPSPGGTGEDRIPPAAPTGLTLASTIAYRVPDQIPALALVSAGWAAVLNDAYPDEATAGRAEAAPLIADRLRSGQQMHVNDEGDPAWTWDNCPLVVATHADALLTEFKQAFPDENLPDFPEQRSVIAEQWLRDYPAAHQGGGPVTADVDHYQVNYSYLGQQPLTESQQWEIDQGLLEDTTWVEPEGSPTRSTSLTFGNIEGGRSLGVRVRAIDRAGNVGPWSPTVAVDTASDDQPPPIPSRPMVSTYLRTINVTWDGKGASGEDMVSAAPDFLSGGMVEVHLAEGIDFIPDRPVGPDGKVDLSLSTTYKTSFYAAGTTNITDLTIGTTYFVRLVAVDRVGNASEPSETSDGVLPKKLVTIEYGPGTIDRETIRQAAIGSAEIDLLAVNDAHIDNVNVGKITAGTMNAQVVLGGRFSTPTVNGNKIEFDNAGIRLYRNNTVVGRWQVSDASMLVTGNFLTDLEGERLELLSNGTMRIYGATGVDYGELANEGGIWRAISRPDANGRRSRIDFDPTGLRARYGTSTQVRSQLDVGLTYGVLNAPVTGIRVWSHLVPDDGTTSRFHFVFANASGDINDATLHYVRNSFKGNDPSFLAPGLSPEGSGITFSNNAIQCVRGNGNAWVHIDVATLRTPSTELVKREISPIRHARGMSSLEVVERVGSYSYLYDWDIDPIEPRTVPALRRQPDGSMQACDEPVDIRRKVAPQRHFGPIAEHLLDLAPDLVHVGRDGQLMVDHNNLSGLMLDALRQLAGKVARLEGRSEPIVVEGSVQDPSRWAELPERLTNEGE